MSEIVEQQVLFRDWTSDYSGKTTSERVLIVKKTPKCVFIDDNWREGFENHEPKIRRLNRHELETKGSVIGDGWWEVWYTTPYEQRNPQYQPEWAVTLGVSGAATATEVEAAYRQRAKETHPDCGGSAEVFKAIRAAYEEYRMVAG
jgi:hypothetical protein